jgi:hypothetical protein
MVNVNVLSQDTKEDITLGPSPYWPMILKGNLVDRL